jgi:hypothetical protein
MRPPCSPQSPVRLAFQLWSAYVRVPFPAQPWRELRVSPEPSTASLSTPYERRFSAVDHMLWRVRCEDFFRCCVPPDACLVASNVFEHLLGKDSVVTAMVAVRP